MKEYKFYIVNDIDRPDEEHVCQEITRGKLEYIHGRLRDWHAMEVRDSCTNIEKFGFDIRIDNGYATFTRNLPSKAAYSNGSHRMWQGKDYFILELK